VAYRCRTVLYDVDNIFQPTFCGCNIRRQRRRDILTIITSASEPALSTCDLRAIRTRSSSTSWCEHVGRTGTSERATDGERYDRKVDTLQMVNVDTSTIAPARQHHMPGGDWITDSKNCRSADQSA